jgi:hypothetical protein
LFEIKKHKSIVTDLPIITANHLILLSDENPILYTGSNKYGNKILGIIVEESDDYSLHYFHVIINDETYYKFIDRKLTLRNILQSANLLFIISTKNGRVFDSNIISFDEIPEDYLPLENSYCPSGFFMPSLNFGVSLKGKTSDNHLIEVHEANSVQTLFAEVLRNALWNLDEFNLKPKCLLEPAKAGSFRVNYRIEFHPDQASLFHVNDELIADFLSKFLNYIIEKLPHESYSFNEKNIHSEAFKKVEDTLEKIYESAHLGVPPAEVLEKDLIENLNKSALKFEDIVNQIKNSASFDRIELINYENKGGELGLGVIDESFYESIREKLKTEDEKDSDVIEKDDFPQTYRVRVYDFSTESGRCWAYFYPDESEYNYKLRIFVNKGNKTYDNSILTKSLDERKVVNIKGIAERINGRIRHITIDL